MAGFAASRSAIRAGLLHSFLELPFVRIEMATRTRQLVPAVHNCLRFETIALFVAIAAGNCHVPACQNEFRRFVLRQGKCRRFVSLQVVTALTTIEVRGNGKLSRMFVGMAIGTALKLDLEERVFAPGSVASRTLHLGVPALEWIGRCGVILYGKC
jgi:hypothetical protein